MTKKPLRGDGAFLAGALFRLKKSTFGFFGVQKSGKKVEIEWAGPQQRAPHRNSVQDAGPNVKNGGMATHLVTNLCHLGSVGVPGPARTPLGRGGWS